ncbi:MAG: hypothetical protein ACLGH0_01380 [Thermoanaerobaculia bacterium]
MKRGVIDTLRRGIDNTIANWQIILIRLAETLLFGIIAVAAIIAIVVPIFVSFGIELANLGTPESVESAMLAMMDKWILLVWIFVIISVLLLVFALIHSFVTAGCARVYVDGERVVGAPVTGPRSRFRVFSMERWYSGAADGWWTLFWIYNLGWGLAGLILLIPLVPTALLMLLFRETPEALLATGCVGMILTVMLMLIVTIVTAMWTTRAITDWAVRREGARDALSSGWRSLKSDFGRHLLIALAVLVVTLAGSSFFATFGFFASFGEALGRHSDPFAGIFTFPLRFAGSFLNSIFSAAVGSWFLAAYGALAVENEP